ncbi:hypothetical protein ACFLYO_00030 [Chloroflexota bacterium]
MTLKRPLIWVGALLGAILIVVTACTPAQLRELQMLAASVPGEMSSDEGLLGGQVAALPTVARSGTAATPTPPPSNVSLPTVAPTVIGPLATLTAIAGLVPTVDISGTPYIIELQGRPHFIEFQAMW